MKCAKKWISYLLMGAMIMPYGVEARALTLREETKVLIDLNFEEEQTGKWTANKGTEGIQTKIVKDSIQGNVLELTPSAHDQMVWLEGIPDIKDGRYSFKIKSNHTDGLGPFVRGSNRSYTYFKYRAGWYLGDDSRSAWNLFDSKRAMWEADTWKDVLVEFKDNNYKMLVDGEVYLDTDYNNLTKEAGQCGINITDGENKKPIYLDDVKIETFGDEEGENPGPTEPEQGKLIYEMDYEGNKLEEWSGIGALQIVKDEELGSEVLELELNEQNARAYNLSMPTIKDGSITFKVKVERSRGFGFLYRGVQGANCAEITENNGWWLGSDSTGRWESVASGKPTLAEKEWHEIELKFQDQYVKVLVDGEVYVETTSQHMKNQEGKLGFRYIHGKSSPMKMWIDDLKVYSNDPLVILPDESKQDNELKLWYTKPATDWETQALPLGNGYMGAMVYGSVPTETIQINDKTLWSGGPNSIETGELPYTGGNVEDAAQYLDEIREALEKGDEQAVARYASLLAGKNRAQNGWGSYQNIGNIQFEFEGIEKGDVIEGYRRELDLNTGMARVHYTHDGIMYNREYFISYPDNVMVFKFEADTEDALNFVLRPTIDDVFPVGVPDSSPSTDPNAPTKEYTLETEGNTIIAKGHVTDNGMKFEVQYNIETDGKVEAVESGELKVTDAKEAVVYVTTGTNYENESDEFVDINNVPDYRGEDPHEAVTQTIEKAKSKGYDQLAEEHLADYTQLFGRVALDLNQGENNLPTDQLVMSYPETGNKNLEVLAYQFGRYLLMSSSREGSLPANLQGVWNRTNMAPWAGDYHFNVNLQMNYWPAYMNNLAETALPLIDYVESIVTPGRITAKEHHGVEGGGWTVHTINNPFGMTAPGWSFYWGWSPASAAWICQNLWEYYEFTEDQTVLEEQIYPIMREAAEFWTKALVEDENGQLISTPAYSPEHGPITKANAYEQSLIAQLFKDTIKASEVLEKDETFRSQLIEMSKQLRTPLEVGEWGQIKEWYEEDEWENRGIGNKGVEKGHRHLSHILGLFPGDLITKDTPELFNAARVSVEDRGDGGTGWSKAQKVGIWARLLDGERAHKIVKEQLINNFYTNLWSYHPPFQIDGNFGLTAGIGEMLLQSHTGKIVPLAALPGDWQEGSVEGLVARGNFEIGMKWSASRLEQMTIYAKNGNPCTLDYPMITSYEVRDSKDNVVPIEANGDNQITFQTTVGENYTVCTKGAVSDKVTLTIETPGEVKANETFEVILGINSEGLPVYAGDFKVAFNTATLALKEIETLLPDAVVVQKEESEGVRRLLVALPGGSLAQRQLLKMNFLAKPTEVDTAGQISVDAATFGIVVAGKEESKEAEGLASNIVIKGTEIPSGIREDVNKDGKVDVADLALVAFYYHKESTEPEWETIKGADVNEDGVIDIVDLTQVAGKILE